MKHEIKAWEPELSRYWRDGGKAQINADQLPLICHDDFKEFDSDVHSLVRVLVGGKGTGKSTALARKAVRLLDDGYAVIPNYHPYVVILAAPQLGTKAELPQLGNTHYWRQIWQLAICLSIIAFVKMTEVEEVGLAEILACGDENPRDREFFDTIGRLASTSKRSRKDCLSPVLNTILSRGYDIETCQSLLNNWVTINFPSGTNDGSYAILIDQVDEAFAEYKQNLHPEFSGQSIWEAAQTGLVDAIRDLEDRVTNLRVYSAIRVEAFRTYRDHGARSDAQIKSLCLEIVYSPSLIREIFDYNVSLTEESRLSNPEAEDTEVRFFGVSSFSHNHVRGEKEPPLQWMVRHTFGSPREMVSMGKAIHRLNGSDRVHRAVVSEEINSSGVGLFLDHTTELVPAWQPSVLEILESITHNVLSPEEVGDIQLKHIDRLSYEPITYLYNCGLIGIPTMSGSNEYARTQKFLLASELRNDRAIPDAPYYIVHPTLYPLILEKIPEVKRRNFHSPQFVPGHGLPCPDTLGSPKVYLIFHETRSRLHISQMTGDAWTHNENEIKEGINSNLTVHPTCNNPPTVFAAVLMTMLELKQNTVSIEEISNSVQQLVEYQIAGKYMGEKDGIKPAADFCRDQLTRKESYLFRALKDLGVDAGVPLEASATPDGFSFTSSELSWTEIRSQR